MLSIFKRERREKRLELGLCDWERDNQRQMREIRGWFIALPFVIVGLPILGNLLLSWLGV